MDKIIDMPDASHKHTHNIEIGGAAAQLGVKKSCLLIILATYRLSKQIGPWLVLSATRLILGCFLELLCQTCACMDLALVLGTKRLRCAAGFSDNAN